MQTIAEEFIQRTGTGPDYYDNIWNQATLEGGSVLDLDGELDVITFVDGSLIEFNPTMLTITAGNMAMQPPLYGFMEKIQEAEEALEAEQTKLHAYLWPILEAYGVIRYRNAGISNTIDRIGNNVHISVGEYQNWNCVRIPIEIFRAVDPVAKATELLQARKAAENERALAYKREQLAVLKAQLGEE